MDFTKLQVIDDLTLVLNEKGNDNFFQKVALLRDKYITEFETEEQEMVMDTMSEVEYAIKEAEMFLSNADSLNPEKVIKCAVRLSGQPYVLVEQAYYDLKEIDVKEVFFDYK